MEDNLSNSRMAARFLKRCGMTDVLFAAATLLAALATVYCGWRSCLVLSPGKAIESQDVLDALEIPRMIADVAVTAEDGSRVAFHRLLTQNRNVVSFYAPWCGPCQKELPELAKAQANGVNLVVLVDKREDRQETRDKLDDLGLTGLAFYQDESGDLYESAKIKALPSVYLLDGRGRVDTRIVGFHEYQLKRLLNMAGGTSDDSN